MITTLANYNNIFLKQVINDIYSLDSIFSISENIDDFSVVNDLKVDTLLKNRLKNIKQKKNEPIVHSELVNMIKDDKTGEVIDYEKLKKLLSKRPKYILNSNEKLSKSGIYSVTLPKYRGLFYDEQTDELKIVNTCVHAGVCKIDCYAGKGGYVMWNASSLKSGQVLTFLLNDYIKWKNQLLKEINEIDFVNSDIGRTTTIRWHDSGDFISEKYLDIVIDIAKETPNVTHYAYTKEVTLFKNKELKGEKLPDNFHITYSFGGIEDKYIDIEKDKYAKIIDNKGKYAIDFKKYYKTTIINKKPHWIISDENFEKLKTEIAEKFNIDINTIIQYKKLPKNIDNTK
ncbi:hypothetical protein M0Q97_07685, partial [Candidatus Dojkabacteria bacterium]|nr:hypothetical protein [Candidatus Dojkabacteria bacterium]